MRLFGVLACLVRLAASDTLGGSNVFQSSHVAYDRLSRRVKPLQSESFTCRQGLSLRGGAAAGTKGRVTSQPVVAASKWSPRREPPSSSFSASVISLVNNVAGAGILALAAGQARGRGTGWVPSAALVALLGYLSAKSFAQVGVACHLLRQDSFKGLWAAAIGPQTTYIVDGMIALLCIACCVIYSGILGDVFAQLLGMVVASPHLTRTNVILGITLVVLFPLCCIQNLSALAFTSSLGFAAILYTVFFVAVRWLDGTYRLGVGKFVTDNRLVALPSFRKASMWGMNFDSLVLASNLGLAFVAHYNAPSFYRELRDTSPRRFTSMVYVAFAALVVLYIITMFGGYGTFGDVCQGNLLLNYHPDDVLALLGRLATGFSILFGFPLVAVGAREGLGNAAAGLGWPQVGAARNHLRLVSGILTVVTLVSVLVRDVSLVVGLTGAALGSFIVYICPAILYERAVRIRFSANSPEYRRARWNLAMVPFGLLVGSLGVYMTLKVG